MATISNALLTTFNQFLNPSNNVSSYFRYNQFPGNHVIFLNIPTSITDTGDTIVVPMALQGILTREFGSSLVNTVVASYTIDDRSTIQLRSIDRLFAESQNGSDCLIRKFQIKDEIFYATRSFICNEKKEPLLVCLYEKGSSGHRTLVSINPKVFIENTSSFSKFINAKLLPFLGEKVRERSIFLEIRECGLWSLFSQPRVRTTYGTVEPNVGIPRMLRDNKESFLKTFKL